MGRNQLARQLVPKYLESGPLFCVYDRARGPLFLGECIWSAPLFRVQRSNFCLTWQVGLSMYLDIVVAVQRETMVKSSWNDDESSFAH